MLTIVVGLIALLAPFVMATVCFLAYLRFCRFVVKHGQPAEGLRDVAVAMRAFAALPLPRSRSK